MARPMRLSALLLIGNALVVHALSPNVDCQSSPQKGYPFCDMTLTFEERTSDLVSRLTLEELIQQTWTIAPSIPRLGLKAYNWRSNCMHGWSASGGHWGNLSWTAFPGSVGLGASFDLSLVFGVASATADEGRALHNIMLDRNDGASTEAAGLNCFSPNINLFRHPLWGRGQETYGEDPYVIAVIGDAYTRGLQYGNDRKYLKTVACAKHFAVHSGPDNIRAQFTANASMHDLYDTYFPAFETQVKCSRVGQIMPAYSGLRVPVVSEDGAPDCANKFLIKSVLREQWGGHNISVCSDNGALYMVYATHHFVKTAEEAAAWTMNATTDLDLGYDAVYPTNLGNAVNNSLVDPRLIQEAVWRNMLWRMRLGEFDPAEHVKYQSYGAEYIASAENQALNLLSAQESLVLLKNTDAALPLDQARAEAGKVAVIGALAFDAQAYLSNYEANADHMVSVVDALITRLGHDSVLASRGCKNTKCTDTSLFADAIAAAQGADTIIAVMGVDGTIEGEGHDRTAIPCNGTNAAILGLPGCQYPLVTALQNAAPGKKFILVLVHGGPLTVTSLATDSTTSAILDAFYPGALGGTAIVNAIFGDYAPAGRLPYSVYNSIDDFPVETDYNMTAGNGYTYRYYTGPEPLYPFGYGLSYTTFEYNNLALDRPTTYACAPATITLEVHNTGSATSDEVLLVFVTPPRQNDYPVPITSLQRFARIKSLAAGASSSETLTLSAYSLSVVNAAGERFINPGDYQITVGVGANSQSISFTISGSDPVAVDSCGVPTAYFDPAFPCLSAL